mmetsp:Transcript_70963/g.230363  ORF Transcript_70963/g.230363 Transcript_70963/m.230363 type:complete len:252 (+) Transcript_70963:298-1053(+)
MHCSSLGMSQMMVSRFSGSGLKCAPSRSPKSSVTVGMLPPASSEPSSMSRPELAFVLRSMCGAMRPRSWPAKWVFRLCAKALAPRTLPLSMGSLKFLMKVAWFPSSPGSAKSMRAQRSCSAFCTGVPVRQMRHRERNRRKLFANSEEMFFMRCASSQMTRSQAFVSPLLDSPVAGNSPSSHSSSSPTSPPPLSASSFFAFFAGRPTGLPLAFAFPAGLPVFALRFCVAFTTTSNNESVLLTIEYDVSRMPP